MVAQVAGAPCAFGPGAASLAGEAVDVDHPQPDPTVVVELVDGLSRRELRAVQHACLIGDVAGQPERWRAARGGRQQDRGVRIARTRLSKRAMRMIANVVR